MVNSHRVYKIRVLFRHHVLWKKVQILKITNERENNQWLSGGEDSTCWRLWR